MVIHLGEIDNGGSGGGGAVTKTGNQGLAVTWTSVTEITIGVGWCNDNEGNLIEVTTPIVLDVSESGDYASGDSRATNTWYHVLLGLDGGSVVACLSETLELPSGWDTWQMRIAIRLNATSGGQIEDCEFIGSYVHRGPDDYANDLSNTSPGTSQTIRAWCPPMVCLANIAMRFSRSSEQVYTGIVDVPPYAKAVFRESINIERAAVINSSGQYTVVQNVAASWENFQTGTAGFYYPAFQAVNYE
ncbi:hypothetical protein [Blastopirellula retiformator]|uniref:Uncharacterized protein n=1 Tax=Blastopirellula retiformator TaxID=2527970 RepID=A0A5C5UYK3_9BACT|nr:hypothetical protein [Blastopirellula retiformator]TWT30723.1 hypothetical protein Enr8_42460 [Blastopirellula retiformator]